MSTEIAYLRILALTLQNDKQRTNREKKTFRIGTISLFTGLIEVSEFRSVPCDWFLSQFQCHNRQISWGGILKVNKLHFGVNFNEDCQKRSIFNRIKHYLWTLTLSNRALFMIQKGCLVGYCNLNLHLSIELDIIQHSIDFLLSQNSLNNNLAWKVKCTNEITSSK